MWILLFFVSCTSLLVKGYGNEDMLGKGRWFVLNLLQCEEPEQYEIQLQITRRKINRTHDAFSFYGDLDQKIDITYGIEIIINKEVDGGYKFYTQITDESFCNMGKKYIGSNWQDILAKGNIDPPDCPIPEGELRIDDYVIDYRQVEETAVYGKFDVYIYLTYGGQRQSCARLLMQFEKHCEEDDDEDDDDY